MGAVKMFGGPTPPPFLERIPGAKARYIRMYSEPLNTGKAGPGRKYILESTVTVLNGVKAKVSANVS